MSQGSAPRQADLFRDTASFVEPLVRPDSIHALLARECHALFPDALFDDLFAANVGRRSVPPMIVAVVMVLQRLEGLSDREAVERFTFDARWKYAAGGQPFDAPGFAHTVLVDMRARLARSERPNRIFERTLEVAKAAGLLGVRRVLDSTPAVRRGRDHGHGHPRAQRDPGRARGLGRAGAGAARGPAPRRRLPHRRQARGRLGRRRRPGRPWSTRSPATGRPCSQALEGEPLAGPLAEAATLLATVLGQDLEAGTRRPDPDRPRVAPDRVISTVDPDTRHGHKTEAHGFDGYKGHVALDPDAELVTAVAVTPGQRGRRLGRPRRCSPTSSRQAAPADPPVVYGDAAYGTGPLLEALDAAGAVEPPQGPARERHRRAASPRTTSRSTSRPGPSPARPGGRCPIRGSHRGVCPVRAGLPTCPLVEPLHDGAATGARSRSAPTRRTSRPAGRRAAIPPG